MCEIIVNYAKAIVANRCFDRGPGNFADCAQEEIGAITANWTTDVVASVCLDFGLVRLADYA